MGLLRISNWEPSTTEGKHGVTENTEDESAVALRVLRASVFGDRAPIPSGASGGTPHVRLQTAAAIPRTIFVNPYGSLIG